MNLGQLRTELRNILGEEEEDFWDDTELDSALNEALYRFHEAEKWPWSVTEGSGTLAALATSFDLEVGVSFPRHLNFLLTADGRVMPLAPKRVEASEGFRLRRSFSDDGSGDPLFFYVTSVADEGANEVQSIVNAGVTTGTFTIIFDGQTTSAVARGASAATIEAALKALSNIGAADVRVTGGPLGTDTVLIEFERALGRANVPEVTLGATSTDMTVATVTADGAPSGEFIYTVRFLPKPSVEFAVEYQYFRVPARLVDDTDVPDMPVQYHMALPHDAAGQKWLKELNFGVKAAEQFELRNAILEQARTEYEAEADDDFIVAGGEEPQLGSFDADQYTRARIPDLLG